MPPVKFSEILSFSSEDPKFPADNLLKPELSKKWKCISGCTEKQSNVTIKLEKLSNIRSIDIGNEGSAFVEVLASREGTDFKVILVASSFMSPLESRNEKDLNRVRMFGPEKLNKEAVEEKWDRIKVVCTQPFNKSLQYGLSFIKVIAAGQPAMVDDNSKNITKLGSFNIQDDDDQSLSIGSFFAKRKEVKDEVVPSGPAAIRAASAAITKSPAPKSLKRKSEEEPRSSKQIKKDHYQSEKPKPLKTLPNNKSTPLKNVINDNSKTNENKSKTPQPSNSRQLNSGNSSTPSNNVSNKKKKHRPFSALMRDVVFVLSGYQNPLRSQLRDKLVEMGAQYQGDWDPKATHLICAYINTPKFKAVKGKGRIVSQRWIEDCYKNKIKYPWRRYDMEKKTAPESDEEIWADEIMPRESKSIQPPTDDNYDEETDQDSDDVDTDDEIQNVLRHQKNNGTSHSSSSKNKSDSKNNSSNTAVQGTENDSDVFDVDTDVDEENGSEPIQRPDTSKLKLPILPSFFTGKVFFLHGTVMDQDKKKQITRYITAFDGKVVNYMAPEVTYVITENKWDDQFEEAVTENTSLQFIKPQWIWKCSDKNKIVPYQPYLIVPS